MPAAAETPLIVALAAEGEKRNKYGAVAPHVVLPFAVEHPGALGKEAGSFFKRCAKQAGDRLGPAEQLRSTWSSSTFSSYFYQQLSMANTRGTGHYFEQAAAKLAGMAANAT